MRAADTKIETAIAEARRIGDLSTLADWLRSNLPGSLSNRGHPRNARPIQVAFTAPGYVRDLPHHRAHHFLGLPLAPPGQRTPILGVVCGLDIAVEGGDWWTPDYLVRMGIFPNARFNSTRVRQCIFAYEVALRGAEWTSLVVMERLKG
jgi:hypothetical protein